MINQRYLELINRDIDNTISEDERNVLNKYLKTNPDAYSIHQDLQETEKLLDKLPDNDPSANLKKRILNSIDFNLYSVKKKKSFVRYLSAAFSGSRRKLTTSFALGMVTGIFLLSIIFYAAFYINTSELNNVFGTMGLPETEVVRSVEVNSQDIAGKLEIGKATNHYEVYVNLKSTTKYTLQIEFDKSILKIDNLSLTEMNAPYSLLFSAKELYPHKFLFKIMRGESSVFEREILLTDR